MLCNFIAFFTSFGSGKTGLTVTVDVYRVSTGQKLVADGAATEFGGGLYKYSYTAAEVDDYVAIFKTSDTTVDDKQLVSLAAKELNHLDVDFSDIPELLWSYYPRSLTQPITQIIEMMTGNTIRVLRGDDWYINFINLGDITNYTKIWFTAKTSESNSDNDADIQIAQPGGLIRLNGQAGTAEDGSITIIDQLAGNIAIALKSESSAQLTSRMLKYDVQMLKNGKITTLTAGSLIIDPDVTRSLS